LSRLFAAVCLVVLSLLALPGALPPFAADAGSTHAAVTSSARDGSETAERAAVLSRKPPARTPRPIRGDGYRVVFKDTFKKLRRRVWSKSEWWNPDRYGRSQYVKRGVLHLVSRRSQGYPTNIAVTTLHSRRFKFGYFEARMKWTKGNGSWPGFWMISNAWARADGNCSGSARAAEIDVFEGYGSDPRVFTGTIHRNSADFICPSPSNAINDNNWHPQRKDLTKRFHTYAMRWTPQRVTWFLDQRRMMSWPTWETTNTRMFLILSMYTGGESQPDASSPDELHTKVDWVRVWQKR
jgi:beta-glucanase (GH16 family)